jgi:hypothetical protein
VEKSVTSSVFEPTTFWLVAQCLNQLRHGVDEGEYQPLEAVIRGVMKTAG